MINKNNPDRNRFQGFLTPTDKDLLRGEAEFEGDSPERDAWYRFRKRTLRAFQDFTFINNQLSNENIEDISELINDEEPDAYRSSLSLIYRLISSWNESGHTYESNAEIFQKFIEDSISSVEIANGNLPEVSVSIEIDKKETTTDGLIEKALTKGLTETEYNYLRWKGEFRSVLQEAIETDNYIEINYKNGPTQSVTPNQAEEILSQMDEG